MNQRCLLLILNREETLDDGDLAQRLNVSAVTVRKTLRFLKTRDCCTGSTAAPCAFPQTMSAIA